MKDSKTLLEKFDKMRKGFNLVSIPTITLNPVEADRFLDCVVDESNWKQWARIERMTLQQKNIRHIGFGSGDFLYNATHFDESKYKKQWAQNLITLNTAEVRGAIAVFDSDLEDVRAVTTEAAFVNQLMSIVARKIANDLQSAFYIADTHGLNTFCDDSISNLWDGWRYIINHSASGQAYYNSVCGAADIKEACEAGSGHDFDLAGLIAEQDPDEPYNWEFKYHKLLKNMPSKYKANNGLSNMVFLNSDLVTQDFIGALSARSTALGDAIFTGKVKPQYGVVPIVDVPLMPTNLGQDGDGTYGLIGGGEYTDVILTPKNNLIVGIQRNIKIEAQRVAADQATYYFYSMRACPAIENVNAIVFLRCLTHEC